jgi:hypothetical protein
MTYYTEIGLFALSFFSGLMNSSWASVFQHRFISRIRNFLYPLPSPTLSSLKRFVCTCPWRKTFKVICRIAVFQFETWLCSIFVSGGLAEWSVRNELTLLPQVRQLGGHCESMWRFWNQAKCLMINSLGYRLDDRGSRFWLPAEAGNFFSPSLLERPPI